MTFTAVVTSHANLDGLYRILGNLMYQTVPPDETLVLCSDTPMLDILRDDFPHARFVECENMEDWGHQKRADGLALAKTEWVGWFNDDDQYDRRYLELMLAYPDSDVVFCNWSGSPDCGFGAGSSTSGNYIVRTRLAQKVGYPETRAYEADGIFINRLGRDATSVVKVDEFLYEHNFQQ